MRRLGYRGMATLGHSKKVAICKPRREKSGNIKRGLDGRDPENWNRMDFRLMKYSGGQGAGEKGKEESDFEFVLLQWQK